MTRVRGQCGSSPGCQGGVGQQGKATGAQWTVQTVGFAGSDRPESGGVWVDLISTIAQEQNVDEWQLVQSKKQRTPPRLRSAEQQQRLLHEHFSNGRKDRPEN